MATASDTHVPPFGESFADLPNQWIEASTRAITASAEIYTEVLSTQAEATRALLRAYGGLGARSRRSATEEKTDQAAEETAPRPAQTARRTTRRAANTTRRGSTTTRRAANTTRRAAKPAPATDKPAPAAAKPASDAAKPAPDAQPAPAAAKKPAPAAAKKPAPAAAKKPAPAAAKPAPAAAMPAPAAAATPAPDAKPAPGAEPGQPPIAGYDGLSADELVAKLAEQPQTTLAEIATYEGANQKRAAVLQRVAALTGPEPAPGYDALSAEDAVKLVANGSPTLAAAVRDYERRHKARASVVEAATRQANADAS
jgi:hypothetical protein